MAKTETIAALVEPEVKSSLAELARSSGYSVSAFAGKVLTDHLRGDTIVFTPNEDKQVIALGAKVELLQEQLDKQTARLAEASEKGALNGVDNKSLNVSKQVADAMAKQQSEWEHKMLQEKYDALKKTHERLEQDYEELESDHDDLHEQHAKAQESLGFIGVAKQVLPAVASGLAAHSPGLKLALDGLGGALGGVPKLDGGSLSDEDQQALADGQRLHRLFRDGNRLETVRMLNELFSEDEKLLNAFVSNARVKEYLTKRQTQFTDPE